MSLAFILYLILVLGDILFLSMILAVDVCDVDDVDVSEEDSYKCSLLVLCCSFSESPYKHVLVYLSSDNSRTTPVT